ncbi:MAG: hypothetical protein ACREWG_03770 [Gammaproteobacteria bacterium]
MPIQQWIQPTQNSLIDTFTQAEQLKNYRSANALAEAKAAELPYAREREAALNTQTIEKARAQTSKAAAETGKIDQEAARKALEFIARFPGDRNAVLGTFAEWSQKMPQLAPIAERLAGIQDPQQFATAVQGFAASSLDHMKEARAERNSQSQIAYRQQQLGISQGHLDVAQENAAETARHHQYTENNPAAGFSMTTNPDGTASISYGTPARNELEKKVINEEDALARLDEIEKTANPDNLTWKNQGRNAILDLKGKLGGQMTPEQARFRDSMTDTRQATLINLTRTIQDLTGAAMGVQEAERIKATVPNLDDAPDVFVRKLMNSTRLVREAIARHQSARGAGAASAPNAPAPVPPPPANILSGRAPVTLKDLEYTAAKHGITIEEVKRRIGAP